MRLPSYLIRNRFGVYYFRIVFPQEVCAILNKKDSRRSLRTSDRRTATSMSMEFQQVNKQLFRVIIRDQMKWIEAKKLFDEVAEKLFQKYVERVNEVGFDFEDDDSLINLMPEAKTFISPSTPEWTHAIHWDQNSVNQHSKMTHPQRPKLTRLKKNIPNSHLLFTISNQGSQ